jgi:hypothetical protein
VVIAQRASDGYVNATAMCQANGKEFSNYFKNKERRPIWRSWKVSF